MDEGESVTAEATEGELMNLSWREVFDPKTPGSDRDAVMRLVQQCGYRYFAWQGGVYEITDDGEQTRLKLVCRVGDLS